MLPAVALGGPDDLLAVVQVVAVAAAGGEARTELVVVDEGLALLIDQGRAVPVCASTSMTR